MRFLICGSPETDVGRLSKLLNQEFGDPGYRVGLNGALLALDVPDVALWRDWLHSEAAGFNLSVRRAETLQAFEEQPSFGVPSNSLQALQIDALWRQGIDGAGVNVGIVDFGFDVNHPSLRAGVASHQHLDQLTLNLAPGGRPQADKSHGTFVAGLVAGRPIDLTAIGSAPASMLHLIEVAEPPAFEDQIAIAANHLVKVKRCKVVNISMGSWKPLPWLSEMLTMLRRNGALPVMAIGNEGQGVVRWPAACEDALSVGYCGEDGEISVNSGSTRFGRLRRPLVPLVVAPGVMVPSSEAGGGMSTRSGSSFAAASVAGLAALLFSAFPGANVEQVESAILGSASFSDGYRERCAYGLPSGQRALSILREKLKV